MKNERGYWTFGPIVGLVVVVLAIIGFFAVCNEDEVDEDLMRQAPAAANVRRYQPVP